MTTAKCSLRLLAGLLLLLGWSLPAAAQEPRFTQFHTWTDIATIKSFVAEDREVARIAEESDRYRDANHSAITLSSAFTPLIPDLETYKEDRWIVYEQRTDLSLEKVVRVRLEDLVTFEEGKVAYDHRDAAGFIKLNALRLRTLAARDR